MPHVILIGDSIFDNARYVPGGPPVIDQLRQVLPSGWQATLLAIDGHTTADVPGQLARLPADATHLVVSAGGNDALGETSLLHEPAATVGDALAMLAEVRDRFRESYLSMLRALAKHQKPTAVCTVYDAVPGLGPAESAALAVFNEGILREAFAARLPVVDLRLICTDAADYSPVSPIEPSAAGGAKIVRAIAGSVTTHEFGKARSSVYCCE